MNLVIDCIYYKLCRSKYISLVLCVDDILLASNDISLLHNVKRFLVKNFKMKDLSDASFLLGIQIYPNHSQDILITKEVYRNRLKRYGMCNCKPSDTPSGRGDMFSLNQYPKNDFEDRKCRRFIMH